VNRIPKAVLLAGRAMAIGVAVGGTGSAHADPPVIYGDRGDHDAVAYAAEAQRLHGDSIGAAKVAAFVCDTMTSRAPAGSSEALMVSVEKDIVNRLKANALRTEGVTISDDQAWYAVFGAEYHFCPQYN
jgi:hypothetical protein